MAVINGTPGNDNFTGTDGNDTILGFDGNDTINGGLGNDDLNGNKGADIVNGNYGNDFVRGGQDNDVVYGGAGHDFHVNGNMGDDLVFGGKGNDSVFGGQGNDVVNGDDGDDFVSGDAGRDTLWGGLGNDTLSDVSGVNDFHGGDGDDMIHFAAGIARGGAGNDVYRINVPAIAGDRALVENLEPGERFALEGLDPNKLVHARMFMTNFNPSTPTYNSLNIEVDGKTIDIFVIDFNEAKRIQEFLGNAAVSKDPNMVDVMVPVSVINQIAPTLTVTIIDNDPTAQSALVSDFGNASVAGDNDPVTTDAADYSDVQQQPHAPSYDYTIV